MTQLITLSKAGVSVIIAVNNIEEVGSNKLIMFTEPQTQKNSTPNTTRAVDLGQIEVRYNIDGFIHADIDSGTVISKKNNFLTIIKSIGTCSMTNPSSAESGATSSNYKIEKYSINEVPHDESPIRSFRVKFTALRCEDYDI